MPNWCYTTYKVEGDRSELLDLKAKMESLINREDSLVENGFYDSKHWLGNIVALFGGDWQKIYCRGTWNDLEYDEDINVLSFNLETAWNEYPDLRHFIEAQYNTIKIYYIEEESGNCVYYTNDAEGKYFTNLHVVEGEDFETLEFDTADEAKEYIEEIIGRKLGDDEDPDEALSEWADDKDTYANYHVFQIVND